MTRIGFIQPEEKDDIHEPVPGYAEAIAPEIEGWAEVGSWLVTVLLNFFLVYGVIAAIRDLIKYFGG